MEEQGKKGEAEAAYGKALTVEPNDAETYGVRGWQLLARKKPAEAVLAFRKASPWHPILAMLTRVWAMLCWN